MFVHVTTSGTKSWRLKYRIGGIEKLLTLGKYPALTIAGARKARDEAKARLAAGDDPAVAKRIAKVVSETRGATVAGVALAWHDTNNDRWTPKHAETIMRRLQQDVFPAIGALPITEIDAPILLTVLRAVEQRGTIETAARIRQSLESVWGYALAAGLATENPAMTVKAALKRIPPQAKRPAITDLDEARSMLAVLETATASPVVKIAMRLIALTAVRSKELRFTPWTEWTNLDAAEPLWTIPAERMKGEKAKKEAGHGTHYVPLAPQAVEAIQALHTLTGRTSFRLRGRMEHCQANKRKRPNVTAKAGRLPRYSFAHGWRSTFSTVMNERHPQDRAVIDLMLAHTPSGKVEAAYNRAQHMARRRALANEWADLILHDAMPLAALIAGRRK